MTCVIAGRASPLRTYRGEIIIKPERTKYCFGRVRWNRLTASLKRKSVKDACQDNGAYSSYRPCEFVTRGVVPSKGSCVRDKLSVWQDCHELISYRRISRFKDVHESSAPPRHLCTYQAPGSPYLRPTLPQPGMTKA